MKNYANLSQIELLNQYGVKKSYLTYHNFGSRISEYLEIDMPFMLMYESLNVQQNTATFLEFTNSGHNYVFNTLSALKDLGDRPLHNHDFYEMTFILSGEVELIIEKESVRYKAGECCLCNRNIRHKEVFNSDFEIILLMFKEDFLLKLLSDNVTYTEEGQPITYYSSIMDLIEKNSKIPYFSAKEYIDFRINNMDEAELNNFISLLNASIDEISQKKSGSSYMVKGYLCRFLSLLENSDLYTIQTHQLYSSKEEDLLHNITHQLEETRGRITRSELEQKLGYNCDYMNRIVKKYTGMTLNEFTRLFTLLKAESLLLNSDMSIGEICHSLGYSNRNYFNQIFTKRYNMPPSEYRKVMRK